MREGGGDFKCGGQFMKRYETFVLGRTVQFVQKAAVTVVPSEIVKSVL